MKPEAKKILLDILKKLCIIGDKDTGNIVIHVNDGGITRVIRQVEIK